MAEQWRKYILDTKRSENENSKAKMEYFIS